MRNFVTMTRINVLWALGLLVLTIGVGCGGGMHVPEAATAAIQSAKNVFRSTALPANGSRLKISTVKSSQIHWSYSGVAYAQAVASTVTITGVSNGYCTSQPGQNTGAPDSFEYVAYGGGQLERPKCDTEWILDRTAYVGGAKGGMNIIGNQTLHGFVIRVDGGTGLGIGGIVTVRRGNQVLSTPFTCNTPAGVEAPECEDGTTTFDVQDHDKVFISLTGHKGDTYNGVQWYLGAQ